MLLNRKLRFTFDLLLRALETFLSKFGKEIFVKKKQNRPINLTSRHFKYLRVKKKKKDLVPIRFSLLPKF